jgi:hypothetical protein
MFNTKNIYQYLAAVGIVILASYFSGQIKSAFTEKNDDYEMIRKYLLNDSPLYGHNRPKIWIHSKYEVNSRFWKSFNSRNSTDLNQPYIHLTVKTIINHCGEDFNVCLIDDETFSRLIPSWDIDITKIAEPMKSHYRELAFMELLYIYGGFIVPNSFVCSRNLAPLYEHGIKDNKPFVLESINRYCDTVRSKTAPLFTPTTQMMGCTKRDPAIRALADYLKIRNQNPHFNSESEFSGYTSTWIDGQVKTNKINLISGDVIGIKSLEGKPILLDDLMEENYLDLCPNRNYGILIPGEEVLNRTKYQWFSVISVNELLKSNMVISKYLLAALADGQLLEDDSDVIASEQGRTVISI